MIIADIGIIIIAIIAVYVLKTEVLDSFRKNKNNLQVMKEQGR